MLTFLLAAAAAVAQPGSGQSAPIMAKYASLALDPAGKRVATIDSEHVRGSPSTGHGTIVLRSNSGKVIERYDPCETCGYSGLTWSRDGRNLAFVASGGGTATLYVLTDGASRKVTSLKGLAATPRWSADGKTIAFLATVDATKESGATQPGVRQVGLIGTRTDSRRIATVPAAGGDYRLVSPDGTFVYEYDWMPDGTGFVGTAAEGDGDNQWWVASLRAFPIGGAMRTIAAPKMQLNFPRVSPDGNNVAFIGGLMSDFPVVGGDVFTVPIAGGTPTNLTPGAKITFTSLAWSGGRLVAGVTAGGSTGVATLDATGKISGQSVTADTIAAGDGAVSLDGTGANAAYVAESFTTAPRIVFGPLGHGHAITHANDALPPLLTVRDIRWHNEGHDVQGWLLTPNPVVAVGKSPMITIVHGGPASASTPRYPWGNEAAAFLAHGYYVFLPNPRGSFGQGEAFVRSNVKDFGGGDLRDILAGIDAVEKEAPVDGKRLGIYGHSYGGFMTMWAITQTNRFGAAVAGAGIANWGAYYGQNGIDQWMIPFFGASAYDDPATYDRMSPIRHIKKAKTPTLLYVGERDVETPAVQSLEYWHGLRAMGVPTELMIYQDEGHGLRDPKNLVDREKRMVGWFDRWLPAQR